MPSVPSPENDICEVTSLYPNLQSPRVKVKTQTSSEAPPSEEDFNIRDENQSSCTPRIFNTSKVVSTPVRSNKYNQSHTPLYGNKCSYHDKENEPCSNNRFSSLRELTNRRRSILKQRTADSATRGPRPSVSFAKQKEVVTFTMEEDQ